MAVRQHKSRCLQLHLIKRTLKYIYSLDSYGILNVEELQTRSRCFFLNGARYFLALGASYNITNGIAN